MTINFYHLPNQHNMCSILYINGSRGKPNLKIFSNFVDTSPIAFTHLVDLKIRFDEEETMTMIFLILQNLFRLECVKYGHIHFTSMNDEVNLENRTIQECRIKNLRLEIDVEHKKNETLSAVNDAFKFILQSCPLLKRFDLSGYIFSCALGSAFNLWFTSNSEIHLHRIVSLLLQFQCYSRESRKSLQGLQNPQRRQSE
jgi:hypothetical protein